MNWKLWNRKKRNQVVIDTIPKVNVNLETKTVKMEVKKMPPYVPPSDKEIIESLEFHDNYEAAYLITSLKKENANLKRKLTILQKKYDGIKQPKIIVEEQSEVDLQSESAMKLAYKSIHPDVDVDKIDLSNIDLEEI
jgi:hypothetical protein